MYSQNTCNYEKYFYWVGSATVDYSSGNLDGAREKFKIAFENTELPLGEDVALALKIAYEVKDTIWANSLSIRLAKCGIPVSYFADFVGFEWFEEFSDSMPSYSNQYKTNFKLELKDKFLALREQDSIFNYNYHEFRKGNKDLSLTELISGAKEIKEGFQMLIKEYGFPCEQNMGYYIEGKKVKKYPTTILMMHIYQRGELVLKNQLSYIVCDGKLRPTDHAQLNRVKGFGDSTGIEQEMKIRFEKYNRTIKYDP